MILKYKTTENNWNYTTIKDLTIGKIDIADILTKYIDKETGKINLFSSDVYFKVHREIDERIYKILGCDFNFTLEKIIEHTNYLLVSYVDPCYDDKTRRCILLDKEAYLMGDDGKTIETLIK